MCRTEKTLLTIGVPQGKSEVWSVNAKDLEVIREILANSKNPWPQVGDDCFILTPDGEVYPEIFSDNMLLAAYAHDAGNCYPSLKEALQEQRRRAAIQRVRDYLARVDVDDRTTDDTYQYSIVYAREACEFQVRTGEDHMTYSPFKLKNRQYALSVAANCANDLKIIFGVD